MTQLPPPPPPPPPPAVPLPPPPPPPAVVAVPARWRDQRGLAVALVVLFGVMLCAAVVLSAALANRISVVQDFKAGDFGDILNRANDADDFVNGASAFYSLTQLVIVVLFIIWQFRAAKNNEALDRPGARFGPGWSIGAWFIPLANLVIPVLIMQDLWRGATPSVPRGDPRWRSAKGSWLVGCVVGGVGDLAAPVRRQQLGAARQRLARRHRDQQHHRPGRRDRHRDRGGARRVRGVDALAPPTRHPARPAQHVRGHVRGPRRADPATGSDAEEPLDRLHRLVDLGVTDRRIRGGGVAHAVAHVLVEQTEPDALQRLRDRRRSG